MHVCGRRHLFIHKTESISAAHTHCCTAAHTHSQKSLIEMYTDVLALLTDFDSKISRKDGKFINTLPQVQLHYL